MTQRAGRLWWSVGAPFIAVLVTVGLCFALRLAAARRRVREEEAAEDAAKRREGGGGESGDGETSSVTTAKKAQPASHVCSTRVCTGGADGAVEPPCSRDLLRRIDAALARARDEGEEEVI